MDVMQWLNNLEHDYNPEYDLCADCPEIRHTDWRLVQIIRAQQDQIAGLERQVKRLLDAVPQAGPPNNGSNRGRNKLFKCG